MLMVDVWLVSLTLRFKLPPDLLFLLPLQS